MLLMLPLLILLITGFYDQLPDDESLRGEEFTYQISDSKSHVAKLKHFIGTAAHQHVFSLDCTGIVRGVLAECTTYTSLYLQSFTDRAPPLQS
jgi:hypothetical protein